MYKAIKGSKIPIIIEIEGFQSANYDYADIEATFYSEFPQETMNMANPKTVTYKKSDNTLFLLPNGNGNQFVAVVDTSKLDTGLLCVATKIKYTNSRISRQVIEICPSKCDVRIIEPYQIEE